MEKLGSLGGLIVVQFAKTNFLLSGWICIVLGASISIAVPDVIGLTISFPLGIAGIILLIMLLIYNYFKFKNNNSSFF